MGSSIIRLKQIAFLTLFTLSFFRFTQADVHFTTPLAGQNVKAGTIGVEWEDSGIAPSIQDLTGFTLTLMVGGNDAGNMLALTTFEPQGTFANGNSAEGTIPSGIAEALDNGFFFQIVSTANAGGTVTNYSPRFNLTGLTGTTPSRYRQAVEDLNGSTNGPSSINTYSNSSNSERAASSTAAATIVPTNGTAAVDPASTDLSITPSASSDLSSMAKALIAAGSVLGGIALCASAVALVFIHHRRKQQKQIRKIPGDPSMVSNAELSAVADHSKSQGAVIMSELSHEGALLEADDGQRRPELDGMAFIAELESSRPGTAM